MNPRRTTLDHGDRGDGGLGPNASQGPSQSTGGNGAPAPGTPIISRNINIDPLSDISLEDAKVASDFLKVLGNENRLIILCALSKHELKVGEMEQFLILKVDVMQKLIN